MTATQARQSPRNSQNLRDQTRAAQKRAATQCNPKKAQKRTGDKQSPYHFFKEDWGRYDPAQPGALNARDVVCNWLSQGTRYRDHTTSPFSTKAQMEEEIRAELLKHGMMNRGLDSIRRQINIIQRDNEAAKKFLLDNPDYVLSAAETLRVRHLLQDGTPPNKAIALDQWPCWRILESAASTVDARPYLPKYLRRPASESESTAVDVSPPPSSPPSSPSRSARRVSPIESAAHSDLPASPIPASPIDPVAQYTALSPALASIEPADGESTASDCVPAFPIEPAVDQSSASDDGPASPVEAAASPAAVVYPVPAALSLMDQSMIGSFLKVANDTPMALARGQEMPLKLSRKEDGSYDFMHLLESLGR